MTDPYDPALFADTPELCGPDQPPATAARSGASNGWEGKRRRRIDGPDRHAYQTLRAHFRTECQARREPCWLCGGPIDYSLRSGHGMAWELDHYVPVSDPVDGDRLALESSNFRASHAVHNRQRAAGTFVLDGGVGDERPGGSRIIDGIRVYWDPELGYPSEVW